MKHFKPFILIALLAIGAFATPPAESPFSIPQPPFYGQVRTRTEFDQKAMGDTSVNKMLTNTQLRTRIGFVATPSEKVEIKVEMQDVRFMGTEPSAAAVTDPTATTGNAKGVDLLQGYLSVQEGPVKVALGRQKMQLGAGRFISTLEWSPTSRSFDGLAGNWTMGSGDLTALYFLVKDTNATVINDRHSLTGLNYNYKVSDNLTVEAYGFLDQDRLKNVYSGDTLNRFDLTYLGGHAFGKFGIFAFDGEFTGQYGSGKKGVGDTIEVTSSAFQLAVRGGVVFPKIKANVGLDMMSGDDKPTDKTMSLYRANYYFAHMYFGWMDYFIANPKYGVMDYRADVDATLLEFEGKTVALKLQGHYFTPQSAPSGSDDPYGKEVDAEFHLGLYPKSNIVLGAAAFFADKSAYMLPAAKLKAGQTDKPGYFFYLMPTFNF